MTEIFVSYAEEDREKANSIAQVLENKVGQFGGTEKFSGQMVGSNECPLWVGSRRKDRLWHLQ